jgi:hypothetical protein
MSVCSEEKQEFLASWLAKHVPIPSLLGNQHTGGQLKYVWVNPRCNSPNWLYQGYMKGVPVLQSAAVGQFR